MLNLASKIKTLRYPLHSDRGPQTHSLWHNRDFFLLWFGQAISSLGNRISSTVALPLLVLVLTKSPAQAGFIAAVRLVPTLILSLLVGSLVDRWDRKKVMIYSDLLRFSAYALVPLAAIFGRLDMGILYIVAFAEGIGSTFFMNAQTAALPHVVPKEQLPLANGYTHSAQAVADTVGPGVAGYIIGLAQSTLAGSVLAFLINSISYLVSVITIGFMRTPFQLECPSSSWKTLYQELGEGWKFLWVHQSIRAIAFLATTLSLIFGPLYLTTIVLAQQSFNADERTIGLLFSLSNIGGIVGALIAPWFSAKIRAGYIIIGTVIARSLVMFLLVTASTLFTFNVGVTLINLLWPIYYVSQISYRQSIIPDNLQGRVNSNIRLFTLMAGAIGTSVGGILLEIFGPQAMVWIMAIGYALSALMVSFFLLDNFKELG